MRGLKNTDTILSSDVLAKMSVLLSRFMILSFKKHIHTKQLKCDRIVLVLLTGFRKFVGNFGFGCSEDNSGLAFSFSLSLFAHVYR